MKVESSTRASRITFGVWRNWWDYWMRKWLKLPHETCIRSVDLFRLGLSSLC